MIKATVTNIAAIVVLSLALSARGDEEKPRAPPSNLKVSAVVPEDPVTVNQLQRGAIAAKLRIKNTGTDTVVIWPFISGHRFEAVGKPVRKALNIGRWGRRSTPSVIEGIRFVELGPGKTHDIPVKINRYLYDANVITGWRLPGTGEYELQLEYTFNREATKKKYGKGCDSLEDKTKPWNQAVELEKKLKLSLEAK